MWCLWSLPTFEIEFSGILFGLRNATDKMGESEWGTKEKKKERLRNVGHNIVYIHKIFGINKLKTVFHWHEMITSNNDSTV